MNLDTMLLRSSEVKECGQINLVDLAGDEWSQDQKAHDKVTIWHTFLLIVHPVGKFLAYRSIKHTQERIKEAQVINSSLMTLKACMRQMREAQKGRKTNSGASGNQKSKRTHVSYRESVLTRVLESSLRLDHPGVKHLGDEAQDQTAVDVKVATVLIATVSPSSGDTHHSMSTLHNTSLLLEDRENRTKEAVYDMSGDPVVTVNVRDAACDDRKSGEDLLQSLSPDPSSWTESQV